MTQCNILFNRGHAAVVTFVDEYGNYRAKIVSRTATGDKGTIELSQDILDGGADYGFDFDLIMDARTITSLEVQNAMRAHGIWTLKDLKKRPQEAYGALLSIIRLIHGELVKGAQDAIGR